MDIQVSCICYLGMSHFYLNKATVSIAARNSQTNSGPNEGILLLSHLSQNIKVLH